MTIQPRLNYKPSNPNVAIGLAFCQPSFIGLKTTLTANYARSGGISLDLPRTIRRSMPVGGLDISRGEVSLIETQIRCVKDEELWILAKTLGVSLEKLFPEGKK